MNRLTLREGKRNRLVKGRRKHVVETALQRRNAFYLTWIVGGFAFCAVLGLVVWKVMRRNAPVVATVSPMEELQTDHYAPLEPIDVKKTEKLAGVANIANLLSTSFGEETELAKLVASVRGGKAHEEEIAEYLADRGVGRSAHLSGPVTRYDADGSGGTSQSIIVAGGRVRVVIVSFGLEQEPKVEWDVFAGSNLADWPELGRMAVGDSGVAFRCLYEVRDGSGYYNHRFAEEEWLCISLTHPEIVDPVWGYVRRGGELAARILTLSKKKKISPGILRIRAADVEEADRGQFEITELLSESWMMPVKGESLEGGSKSGEAG